MKKKITLLKVFMTFCLLLVSITNVWGETTIPVTRISVSPATTTVRVGQTKQLSVAFTPTDATNKNVTWTSDQPEVATVDETGLVTTLKAGIAAITATSEDGGFTSNCVVTVENILKIDFERTSYNDWTFADITTCENGTITAHGGTYYGTTNQKDPASITTKEKVANPGTFTCYVSKQTDNSNSSTWKIQVSSDGSIWTDVASRDAASMNKGVWEEFKADLSTYKDVYVRIYYSGSTAVRNIDDVSLTLAKNIKSISVMTAPTTTSYKTGDFFDPTGLVITATYDDESTEDVSYEGHTDKFTLNPDLETPLTKENTSVNITYEGKTTTQEITVRAIYDITWMANAEEFRTTEVTEGDALALPETNPDNIGDMVFQGWINTENYFNATTAPEYINPAEIFPTEAMTFYAVFAKAEEVEEPKVFVLSPTNFNEGEYGDNDGDKEIDGITLTIKDVMSYLQTIQMKESTGSLYSKDALGQKITSVLVDVKTNSVKVYEGSENDSWTEVTGSDGNYTFSDNKAYFKVTSTDLYARVNNISVHYIDKTTTYSNYRTFVTQVPVTINKFDGKDEGNASFCSTFDLDFTDLEGIGAYIGKEVDGEGETKHLNLLRVDKVPTGTGIFVIGQPGTHLVPIYTGEKELEPRTDNSLIGTLEPHKVLESENIYALSKSDGNLHPVNTGVTIGAGKSYYKMEGNVAVSVLTLTIIDEPTGINSINENINENENLYNLQGMRVTTPKKGKVYIMNGKKFLMK